MSTSKAEGRRLKRIATVRAGYHPRKVPGTPAIGFPAKPVTTPRWQVGAGDFALDLVVRSAGGSGRGIVVRLSGDALSALEVQSLGSGDARADFEPHGDGLRAELTDVDIVEGFVMPLDPKPSGEIQKGYAEEIIRSTHFTLTLHGRALEPCQKLLRVEIGALGESSTPLALTRPLTIE